MKLYLFTKRLIDIVLSSTALVCLTPILAAAAALVKLDGGPVFYSQTRIGKNGKPFKFYKIRSMSVQADAERELVTAGSTSLRFKDQQDPRITNVGRFLRKASIDELPQLWNVLKGDMTLVGPRPAIPEEVSEYTEHQRQRLKVKQGITCYWQVKGRSLIPFEEQVELDLDYIENMSLVEDFKILFLTVPAVVFGVGAY